MLNNIPLDTITLIFFNLDSVHDIIKFILLNKYFYNTINDSYFKQWGINYYSKDFWNKAKQRSKCLSKPLNSMKFELIRIHRFITCMKKENIIWSNTDFYNYWNMLEDLKKNKFKTTKNYLLY